MHLWLKWTPLEDLEHMINLRKIFFTDRRFIRNDHF